MQSRLPTLDSQILVGCVDALHRLRQQPQPSGYGHHSDKRRWADAQEGLVRCDPGSWADVNMSTPADRQAVSRAYKRLERLGLIERIADGGTATTHLEPTEAGKTLVASLLANSTPPYAISTAGLHPTSQEGPVDG